MQIGRPPQTINLDKVRAYFFHQIFPSGMFTITARTTTFVASLNVQKIEHFVATFNDYNVQIVGKMDDKRLLGPK